jgi:hypothetical protein
MQAPIEGPGPVSDSVENGSDQHTRSESFATTWVMGYSLHQFTNSALFHEALPSLWLVEHFQDIEDFES